MPDDGGFTVHVVDDDGAVRESLEALLVVVGYAVATYDSAEAFLASAEPSGCLLLDVNLPGLSGLELLADLSRRLPGFPVVILTSREPALADRAFRLGAAGFLPKPVEEAALLAALDRAAAHRAKPLYGRTGA